MPVNENQDLREGCLVPVCCGDSCVYLFSSFDEATRELCISYITVHGLLIARASGWDRNFCHSLAEFELTAVVARLWISVTTVGKCTKN